MTACFSDSRHSIDLDPLLRSSIIVTVSSNRRVRMKDIAATAGVSVQTVSNLVNGRYGQMSATTRARVENVMKELAFRPNPAARGLRSARSETLGFLILDDASRFLADPMTDLFLAGLGDVLRERGYALLIQASRPSNPIASLLTPLLEGRIDGAVISLSGPPAVRARYIKFLGKLSAPCVLLQEHSRVDGNVSTIAASDREGSRLLCRRLLENGHQRIAFLTGKHRWSAIDERFAGYLEAHREAGVDPDAEYSVRHGNFGPSDAADAARILLSLPVPPTAIMCANDLLACGAVRAARDLGLRVPADLAVTGFDDFDFAAAVDPSLTTVSIPGYEMGGQAATDLIETLLGKPKVVHRRYPTSVRVRESG